jgi:predicted adenine nucleotide alpha hydrolase (AANH) superfamily ATPase
LVDGLFFNPNIYPDEEGEKRWLTYQQWANQAGLRTRRIEMPYEQWVKAVSKPGQCRQCYYVRLERTAQIAKAEGYDGFSTTLLVSPYQDHQGILIAMERASREHNIPYVYRDLRPGYRRSRQMARGNHMYMQKYCGCEFSMGGE